MNETQIIFFNHGSVWSYLNKEAGLPGELSARTTFVELGTLPYLTHYAGLHTPEDFPGIAAVLDRKTGLERLAVEAPDSRFALILAPGQGGNFTAVADAWRMLENDSVNEVAGLIGLWDAAELLPKLEPASRISLFWDLDVPPSAELGWVEALAAHFELLDRRDRWQGIHFYSGKSGEVIGPEDLDELQQQDGILELSKRVGRLINASTM